MMDSENAITLALLVSYNGKPFSGFARQEGQKTVQGELEDALRLLFRRDVETVCAGRTDAGVHALGQVVSFSLSQEEFESRSLRQLRRSLDALTSEEICVRSVDEKKAGFSARFDAKAREYHYHFCLSEARPMFMDAYSWHVPYNLDVEAMREAASYLVGEHDFKSFCLTASAEGKRTYRCVQEISFYSETIMGEEVLTMKIVGNAFLHSMVRTIAGTLLMVGRGQRRPSWVKEVLDARCRQAAGQSAPAKGLVFWQVFY